MAIARQCAALGFLNEPLVGRNKKTTCATRRVSNTHVGFGRHHLHNGAYDRARCEILTRPTSNIFGVACEQTLVNLTLYIEIQF